MKVEEKNWNKNIFINKDNNERENDINQNIIMNENKKDKNEQLITNDNNQNSSNKISWRKIHRITKNNFSNDSTTKKCTSQGFVRGSVSKDKNNFSYNGFDLDLTYITPKIIAMEKPSTSIEGMYRNNLDDVVQFFNQRHHEDYKVYNLCRENFYPTNTFYNQRSFPFQDHEAPPLNLINPFYVD